MSALLASLLLVCALVLPFVTALALRTFRERLTSVQGYGIGVTVLLLAFASVLVLARSNIDRLQVGNLTLLLPIGGASDTLPELPGPSLRPTEAAPPTEDATAPPVATAALTPTLEPTAVPTATPEPPTATPEPPTATPEPPTPEPPTQAPAPPPPARRTYRVQSGDTLRSIAERFNVSVQDLLRANNMTPEQADALKVDSELIIP